VNFGNPTDELIDEDEIVDEARLVEDVTLDVTLERIRFSLVDWLNVEKVEGSTRLAAFFVRVIIFEDIILIILNI